MNPIRSIRNLLTDLTCPKHEIKHGRPPRPVSAGINQVKMSSISFFVDTRAIKSLGGEGFPTSCSFEEGEDGDSPTKLMANTRA